MSFLEMVSQLNLLKCSVNCIGFKKALCKENVNNISVFTNKFTNYIKGLKVKEIGVFVPILDSKRKTGFIGFVGGLHSALLFYNTFVELGKLGHIKLYKCSQDYIELFFGTYSENTKRV